MRELRGAKEVRVRHVVVAETSRARFLGGGGLAGIFAEVLDKVGV